MVRRMFWTIISLFILIGTFFSASADIGEASNRGMAVVGEDTVTGTQWGTYHALVIGINDYAFWPRLHTAVKDARVFHKILIDKYGFKSENTNLLIDKQASRENILRYIRRFASTMEKNDNLLIYFAGHGQLDQLTGDGYWIPAEGEMKETWTWVPNATIKALLGSDQIQAKNIIVIADSCYSGAMLRGGPSLLSLTERDYKKKLQIASSRRSRQVISSGGVEPVADGGADGHSLFAYYLIKALQTNDWEVIDLENLFHTRVWKSVTEIGLQRPNVGRLKSPMDDGGQFVLYNVDWAEDRLREAVKKREQDAERKAAEARKAAETKRLAEIEAERQRLEWEREKLEMEKALLAQKQQLEMEKLKIEREKQRLEYEKRASQWAFATTPTPPEATPPTVSNRDDKSGLTFAIMPMAGLARHPNRAFSSLSLANAFVDATKGFDTVTVTHSFYKKINVSDLNPIHMSSEEAKALWIRNSLFAKSQPDVSRVVEMGKRVGFDFAFFLHIIKRDPMDLEVSIYFIDVNTNKMHTVIKRGLNGYTLIKDLEEICREELKAII